MTAALADAQDVLPAWTQHLGALSGRIARRFSRAEPRRGALAYLRGLLSTTERKNAWQLAETLGYEAPYGVPGSGALPAQGLGRGP